MKHWLVIFAAVASLALPAMASASDEADIPPEANWTAMPPTPAYLVVSQERVVSTAQEQASDTPRPSPAVVTDNDAQYKAVDATMHDD